MATTTPFDPQARLQSKEGICHYLGHISPATYDAWQAKGIVPGPIPGTTRYDRPQHDHMLDLRAGIERKQAARRSALDDFEANHAQSA